VRPRRILRRFYARATHWGTPHVHCPSCGGDTTVPPRDQELVCFVCHVRWFRVDLTGDDAADWGRVQAQARALGARADGPGGRPNWAVVWRPLLVDCPDGRGGKRTETLDSAFGYLLGAPQR
jgi:hypothetical protein